MASEELQKSWRRTQKFLVRASEALANNPAGNPEFCEFFKYMEANELELACDELEAFAVRHKIDGEDFWRSMKDACVSMALYERAAFYLDIATGHTKLDTD